MVDQSGFLWEAEIHIHSLQSISRSCVGGGAEKVAGDIGCCLEAVSELHDLLLF